MKNTSKKINYFNNILQKKYPDFQLHVVDGFLSYEIRVNLKTNIVDTSFFYLLATNGTTFMYIKVSDTLELLEEYPSIENTNVLHTDKYSTFLQSVAPLNEFLPYVSVDSITGNVSNLYGVMRNKIKKTRKEEAFKGKKTILRFDEDILLDKVYRYVSGYEYILERYDFIQEIKNDIKLAVFYYDKFDCTKAVSALFSPKEGTETFEKYFPLIMYDD